MPSSEREKQAQAAQIAALQREHAGYLSRRKQDRADQVAALLADLGAPVKDADKPRPRGRRRAASSD